MCKKSLIKAVEIVGGQVALASKIRASIPGSKVTQAFVWKWLNALKGETPPAEYAIPIAAATDWQVTPHELRPDIYPNPCDGLPAHGDRRHCDRRAV